MAGATGKSGEHFSSTIEEELLTCTICLEGFTNPKVLPCHHTFCRSCLEPMIQLYNVECPVCRRSCPVTENNVDNLPTDFRVNQLKDIMESRRSPDNSENDCDFCKFAKQKTLAERFCINCNKLLCKQCVLRHQGNKHFASHNIVDNNCLDYVKCKKHDSEMLTLYCFDCETLICVACVITGCENHSTKDIQEAYKILIEPAKKMLYKEINTKANVALLQKLLTDQEQESKKICEKIRECAESLTDEILRKKESLLEGATHNMMALRRKIHQEMKRQDALTSVGGDLQTLLKNCLEPGNEFKFLGMQSGIVQLLTNFSEISSMPADVQESSLVFTPSTNALDIGSINVKNIAIVGDVRSQFENITVSLDKEHDEAVCIPQPTIAFKTLNLANLDIGQLKHHEQPESTFSVADMNIGTFMEHEQATATGFGSVTCLMVGTPPPDITLDDTVAGSLIMPDLKDPNKCAYMKIPYDISNAYDCTFLPTGEVVIACGVGNDETDQCSAELILFDVNCKQITTLRSSTSQYEGVCPKSVVYHPILDAVLATDRESNKLHVLKPFIGGNKNFKYMQSLSLSGTSIMNHPSGIDVMNDGKIVITDTGNHQDHGVVIFDLCGYSVCGIGKRHKHEGYGQFSWPIYVTTDKHDRVIISDQGHQCIQIYDKNLENLLKTIPVLKSPQGVTTDEYNNIWVAFDGADVSVYNSDGRFITCLNWIPDYVCSISFNKDFSMWCALHEEKAYLCKYTV